MVRFGLSVSYVDEGKMFPVIQEIREQPCDVHEASPSGVRYTWDGDHSRRSAAHSWKYTYYFSCQHNSEHYITNSVMWFDFPWLFSAVCVCVVIRSTTGEMFTALVWCLFLSVGVCGNKGLLAIPQVALTFISGRQWELMLSRHTHKHTLSQMSSTMTT